MWKRGVCPSMKFINQIRLPLHMFANPYSCFKQVLANGKHVLAWTFWPYINYYIIIDHCHSCWFIHIQVGWGLGNALFLPYNHELMLWLSINQRGGSLMIFGRSLCHYGGNFAPSPMYIFPWASLSKGHFQIRVQTPTDMFSIFVQTFLPFKNYSNWSSTDNNCEL